MAVSLKPVDHLYEYQALDSANTFRLLKLHAGHGEKIFCSIQHHTLGSSTCPSYRAVSYTWGKDNPRYSINLPGGTVIKIRENLKDALRFVRDEESDCWLWIDAICINQRSNAERNHQVRLMSDIYGNANVVLVWLQSAGESADVAKAFKFVHAAATYDETEHSVYNYLSEHSTTHERNWRSPYSLCKLRYWSRKWIIQELVVARTAVLQMGNSQCSMADLERFCRQLHQDRSNDTFRRTGRRQIWDFVVASVAARLALQRSEQRDEQQPRLLHELIEQYASSECENPCDHVYALYSLVGEHRTHFEIEYEASPVERLVSVLAFVTTYESLQPARVLEFAYLLMKLFLIKQDDFRRQHERSLAADLNMVVLATLLGTAELQPESEASIGLRRVVKPLDPMPTFTLNTSHAVWVLTVNEDPGSPQERVGRQDMTYFSVANSGFHGLAACRVEAGDEVWHFPETQLVFAVRPSHGNRALLLGRAYLFSAAPNGNGLEHWLGHQFDYNSVRRGERHVSTNLGILLELGSLGIPAKDMTVNPNVEVNVKASWLIYDVKAMWKKEWRHKVVIAGSILISVVALAVILTQVIN